MIEEIFPRLGSVASTMLGDLLSHYNTTADILAALLVGAVVKTAGLGIILRNKTRNFVQVGTVSELYLFPLKSCGVFSVQQAQATSVGLVSSGVSDRYWMVLGGDGKKINMKQDPRLTTISPSAKGDNLLIQAPDMTDLLLPLNPNLSTKRETVKASMVSGDPPSSIEDPDVTIISCGQEADKWMSTFLGYPARLVYSCPELGTRNVYGTKRLWDNTSHPDDKAVLSYLTSYMMSSTASLHDINQQLEQPVTSVNFRPNIVVNNTEPWDEDNWKELRIGEKALFHSVEPCVRCMITTINPTTGERSKTAQPLKQLKKYRCKEPYGKSPIFGNYMSLDIPGHIAVGDPVYALY